MYLFPALFLMGLITLLSHQTGDTLGVEFHLQEDKVIHLAVYTLLSVALLWGSSKLFFTLPLQRLAIYVFGTGVLFGLVDEWHQSFIPGRTSSGADLLADSLGVFLGIVVWQYYLRKKRNETCTIDTATDDA